MSWIHSVDLAVAAVATSKRSVDRVEGDLDRLPPIAVVLYLEPLHRGIEAREALLAIDDLMCS